MATTPGGESDIETLEVIDKDLYATLLDSGQDNTSDGDGRYETADGECDNDTADVSCQDNTADCDNESENYWLSRRTVSCPDRIGEEGRKGKLTRV